MNQIKLPLIALMAFSAVLLSAQTDSLDLPTEKIEVVKRYEAAILQAKKKKISFELDKNVLAPINYNYKVTTEKVIDFERPDPEIKALGYKGEVIKNDNLKDGYIYGAYGTQNTISAGSAYHYYIEDWLDAGFNVDYMSASTDQSPIFDELGVAGLTTSEFRNTKGDVYFGYNLGLRSKLHLKGHTEYANHVTYTDLGSKDMPFYKYGVDLGLSQFVFEDKGMTARLNTGFDYAKHRGDNQINDKIFRADLNVFKDFNGKWSIELPVNYQRTIVNNLDTAALHFGDLVLEPNVRIKGDNYTAKAGVQYITGDSASYVFPILDVSLPSVFAGVDVRLYTDSKYARNSFYEIIALNPYFLSSSANYSPNYERSYNLDVMYGLNDFKFGLGFSYLQFDNSLNFIDYRTQGQRSFATYLDRDQFSICPSVSYTFEEQVAVYLTGQYNIFLTDLPVDMAITYQPDFALDLTAEQLLFDDKFVLNQSLIFNSKRTAFTEDFTQTGFEDINAFWDVSLKATYRISNTFEVFARGTNLLGSEYYAWSRQFVLPQQLYGGLKVRI